MADREEKFMTVKEAAGLLGVSPNTLRSWGAGGKIAEYRHPLNNYRLFKQKDVQALLKLLGNPTRNKSKRGSAKRGK
ncbi:helix-turn-helix domain-containing protein [Aeoliella sp.]|uniref:helix-turn-helix domain-containing protein n=1 Tax=Aeoliella sp. TaxID=2795800 RepID=UPI003CCBB6D0